MIGIDSRFLSLNPNLCFMVTISPHMEAAMDRSCLSKEDDQRSGGRQIRGMVCEEELQEEHAGLWVREGRSSRGKVRRRPGLHLQEGFR